VASPSGGFAIALRDRPGQLDGILMLVDDARCAEELAVELRSAGHDVEVRAHPTPALVVGDVAR
jgi:hypothetical protein